MWLQNIKVQVTKTLSIIVRDKILIHKRTASSLLSHSTQLIVASVAYLIFLVGLAFIYQSFYITSLNKARLNTDKICKQAVWRIAIGLYVQSQRSAPNSKEQESLSYRAQTWLSPQPTILAFSFVNPNHFLSDFGQLNDETHIVAELDSGGKSGPAKSMPTGPYYFITSRYHYFKRGSQEINRASRFTYEDDPLAYSRFPSELAPAGILDGGYYSPPIVYSRKIHFSVSVPQDVFLEKCANHIESHLQLLVDKEYCKWQSIGRLSTFLYFAATFGLGEIGPGSQAVRLMLVFQIIVSVSILSITIPKVVSSIKRQIENTRISHGK